jgi:hypothetical protein
MKLLSGTVACLLLLLIVAPSPANDPYPEEMDGRTTDRGYRYHDGYWWKNGISFTRHGVYETAYRSYGCCGQTQAYQRLVRVDYEPYVVAAPPYVAPLPTVKYTPNWQTEALKTMAKRDDLNAFSNTVQTLNATAIQGTYPSVTAHGTYAGGYGVSGTTLYARGGYNALTSQLYSTFDLNGANIQYAQATNNLIRAAKDAHGDFGQITSQFNEGARQVAVIQALASGSQQPPVSASTSFQAAPTAPVAPVAPQAPQTPQTGPTMPRAPEDVGAALTAVWQNRCASCHTGAQAQKGFTFQTYQGLSRQAKIDKVWMRLVSEDSARLMPRTKDGVGQRLPDSELAIWHSDILNMPSPTQKQ